MKIHILGPTKPYRGGIAHFGNNIELHLGRLGHTVSVANFKRMYPHFLFPGRTQLEGNASDVAGAKLDIMNPFSWVRLGRSIAQGNPDIFLFQYWEPYFVPLFWTIVRMVKRHSIPVLCIAHNARSHDRKPMENALGRLLLRHCDEIVVLSASVATDLSKELNYGKPPRLLYHPPYDHFGPALSLQAARMQLSWDLNRPTVLFFGFVRSYKGITTLLEAIHLLSKRIPTVKLVIAGEIYQDADKLFDFIKKRGLEENIVVNNRYIEANEVQLLFCATDIVVLPYTRASQSGVLATAHHFETPYAISHVRGLVDEPIAGWGLRFEPGDSHGLADQLFRFFQRRSFPGEKMDLVRWKSTHSWQNFCIDLVAIMRAIHKRPS